ncbi:hypothetical protein HOLleu_19405 [Holothuria leucospilota]|uniref:Uncharacterized protein n=1 Tax=Holothuria leucospilota TaxID=206669 RepID=A0A9Q1BZW1_HOLLE|nr:hypothetical protein HOLleu_19405 [Holothuria leucospilota]
MKLLRAIVHLVLLLTTCFPHATLRDLQNIQPLKTTLDCLQPNFHLRCPSYVE